MYKVLLWGLGNSYNIMKNTISYFEYTKQLEVVAIIANDVYMSTLDGYPVIKPNKISVYIWDYIIVMSDNSFETIVDNAVADYKIPRSKLIPYKILQIPDLILKDYIKLKESNISIISNNCWGGIIYQTLGLECKSPFKNLFLYDDDYLRLISNLEKYMELEPQFSHYEDEPHSGIKYPVLQIDDVQIHCNHVKDSKIAIDDWNRRKKKINYDNLFIEMYTSNREAAEIFITKLNNNNGICFVPWESDHQHLMTLELAPGQKEFWQAVNVNASLNTYGLKYSLIDLLNGKMTLRYY